VNEERGEEVPVRARASVRSAAGVCRTASDVSSPKVELWDGSEAWLALRHQDIRALLANALLPSDTTKEGFHSPTSVSLRPALVSRRSPG